MIRSEPIELDFLMPQMCPHCHSSPSYVGLHDDLACYVCSRAFPSERSDMIPSTKIVFLPDDKSEILLRIGDILDTGFLAQGENVREFELEFARRLGVKHAVATSNGGAALQLVLMHLGASGEVLVPTNTFVATATSVVMAGGTPVFVDIDPATMAPCVDDLEQGLTDKTKGVVIVHIGGVISPDMLKIREWCDAHGLWLVEDCAHAHGSVLQGKAAGTFGVAGCYSFFATKVMTSGEGGMIVTDSDDLASEARIVRDYGKPEPWVSYHTMLGGNFRMNELEAAVGVVQLKRLSQMIDYRMKVATAYSAYLTDFGNRYPSIPKLEVPIEIIQPKGKSSWYKYVVVLPQGVSREKVKALMKEMGVSTAGGVFEIPLHKQPVFMTNQSLPKAEGFADRHLCLPIFFTIKGEEVKQVARAFIEAANTSLAA